MNAGGGVTGPGFDQYDCPGSGVGFNSAGFVERTPFLMFADRTGQVVPDGGVLNAERCADHRHPACVRSHLVVTIAAGHTPTSGYGTPGITWVPYRATCVAARL